MLCARLEPGSGSGGNKAIIISAKYIAISHGRIRRSTREQQSHTEEHERIRRIARGANNNNNNNNNFKDRKSQDGLLVIHTNSKEIMHKSSY